MVTHFAIINSGFCLVMHHIYFTMLKKKKKLLFHPLYHASFGSS